MIARNFLAWASLPINIYQSSRCHCTTSFPKSSQLCTYGSPRIYLSEEESSFADLMRSSCSYSTNSSFDSRLPPPPADTVGHSDAAMGATRHLTTRGILNNAKHQPSFGVSCSKVLLRHCLRSDRRNNTK